MTDASTSTDRRPLVLAPGEGRSFPMGRISAVFKADGAETAGRYSVSEWWLDPHTQGPGPHSHPEDDVFFVLDGTLSFLVRDEWVDAPTGSFVLVPAGVTHDFENRGDTRAGRAQHLGARRLRGEHACNRRLVRRAPSGRRWLLKASALSGRW